MDVGHTSNTETASMDSDVEDPLPSVPHGESTVLQRGRSTVRESVRQSRSGVRIGQGRGRGRRGRVSGSVCSGRGQRGDGVVRGRRVRVRGHVRSSSGHSPMFTTRKIRYNYT